MSGTYPSTPEFSSIDFRINTPTQTSETVNGRKLRAGFGTSFYTFTGKYATLPGAELRPVAAFIAKQYGQNESFQIVIPGLSYSRGADNAQAVGNARVKTSATKGAFSVALKNLGANKEVFKQGDVFKFANHTKVYIVTDDVVSNGSGEATIYFSGKLVENVAADVFLTVTAVPFTVILDQEVDEFSVGPGGLTNLEVSFREVW